MFKKEIFVTQKVEIFSKNKAILDRAGIKYKTKVINHSDSTSPIFSMIFSSSRRARGSLLGKDNQTRLYYIYVDKKDEEYARKLLCH